MKVGVKQQAIIDAARKNGDWIDLDRINALRLYTPDHIVYAMTGLVSRKVFKPAKEVGMRMVWVLEEEYIKELEGTENEK